MQLYRVHQQLYAAPVADVAAEVRRQLDRVAAEVPTGEVAVTVGSRGIRNLGTIVRTAGEWLREHGAQPFLIPCMGSHNGASAAGQRAMIESFGITESAMGMPIRASMECQKVGEIDAGEVWMDRFAYQAAGTLVINRIKPHTLFSGSVESGLVKMMVVGMGNARSARTFHSVAPAQMGDTLLEMGKIVLGTGKIWAGLAILEDGFDHTSQLQAIDAASILRCEPALLETCRQHLPRLPVDDLQVLIVDEIGKTISGTGMDTNVIGRRGVHGLADHPHPQIRAIAVLGLHEHSQGNALGVGLADFITKRMRDQIDESKTLINALTTTQMARAKIPATLKDDQDVFTTLEARYGSDRWAVIRNTLQLSELFVSHDLLSELEAHPRCTVDPIGIPCDFRDGRLQLFAP